MKEVSRNDDIVTYEGIRDAFGNKAIIKVNETLQEFRLYGKNPEYKKKRKYLDSIGCQKVYVPEMLEVIDVTRDTLQKLEKTFAGYKHTNFQVVG